jgi:hypothetical protein
MFAIGESLDGPSIDNPVMLGDDDEVITPAHGYGPKYSYG